MANADIRRTFEELVPQLPPQLGGAAITVFTRGVQWAATGRITVPIPTGFPGPDKTSLHKLT